MAYVSNETKSKISAALKPIFKSYGVKATVARNSHKSTLVVNISAGDIDFGADYLQVNVYHIDKNHVGKARFFLNEVLDAIKSTGDWYDNSDAMTDYFNTAFYIDINVGRWDKPYKYNNANLLDDVLQFKALKELGKLQLIYVR
jgi:hypothetical protein